MFRLRDRYVYFMTLSTTTGTTTMGVRNIREGHLTTKTYIGVEKDISSIGTTVRTTLSMTEPLAGVISRAIVTSPSRSARGTVTVAVGG